MPDCVTAQVVEIKVLETKALEIQAPEITDTPTQIVRLRMPPGYTFSAGQYLQVVHQGTLIPLSIASAPQRLPELELHYRSTAGAPEAAAMDAALQQPELQVTLPGGQVSDGDVSVPLLVVAGGTGAAQAFALAEQRSHHPDAAGATIVWCAERAADVYAEQELRALADVELIVMIDSRRSSENRGLSWLRTQASAYRDHHIVLAGSPGFVYAATDVLLDSGISRPQLHADVYEYAPRPD